MTIMERLATLLSDVLDGAEPGESIEHQAARLIEAEPELIADLTPQWQLAAISRLLRIKRAEIRRKHQTDAQYLLPGFDRIPQRIQIATGQRRRLANATYRQLREYLASLHKRHREDAVVAQVKTLVALVQKYARETPGITVKEVCRREAGK